MANNQDFVRNLFRDIAADGFAKKFEDALDDDLVWVATGSSPLSGEHKGKQAYLEKIIGQLHTCPQSWPKAIVENILVDGDVACVQFHREGGIGKNGADFDMRYCWVKKVRNQKIVHPIVPHINFVLLAQIQKATCDIPYVTGYYDSVKMAALFKD